MENALSLLEQYPIGKAALSNISFFKDVEQPTGEIGIVSSDGIHLTLKELFIFSDVAEDVVFASIECVLGQCSGNKNL